MGRVFGSVAILWVSIARPRGHRRPSGRLGQCADAVVRCNGHHHGDLSLTERKSRRVIGVVFGIAFIIWVLTEPRLRTKHVLIGASAVAALLLAF